MSDTKDKILKAALELFAQDGYEAVSVSAIAGKLGMTKGALYKHYKNKRAVFDSIVERMHQIDEEHSKKYSVPESKYDEEPGAYKNTTVKNIADFTIAQFRFWTEDKFGANFRKLLTLEQYRNKEMAELYTSCLTSGPIAYIEDIFREIINKNSSQAADAGRLAAEYYAPFCLLITLYDHSADKSKYVGLLHEHIRHFFAVNPILGE